MLSSNLIDFWNTFSYMVLFNVFTQAKIHLNAGLTKIVKKMRNLVLSRFL